VERGRALEILQPVRAEVAQRIAVEQGCGRRGHQDLAAVCECGDPHATMDVDPDVALAGERGRPGMEPDAHADRPLRQRREARACRVSRAGGGRERDEEGVALRVDLDAIRGAERLAQQQSVLGQRVRVSVGPERLEQAGRALDVGEQEGDRARRQR
jgi:hypothetical protein